MKRRLKKYLKQLGFKGRVRNHSSKQIWVIENTSTNGRPVAHVLKPGMKSKEKIDTDGFKRVDGKSIDGHKNWWKITDVSTADVFDWGQGLAIAVIYKTSVNENHFGKPIYKKNVKWGVPINYIVDVERGKKRTVEKYLVSHIGWVDRKKAIKLAMDGEIDLVIVVNAGKRNAYLRSFPGQPNFGEMG